MILWLLASYPDPVMYISNKYADVILFRSLIYMDRAVETDYVEVWVTPSRD